MTDAELKLIANAAMMGESDQPVNGKSRPAANKCSLRTEVSYGVKLFSHHRLILQNFDLKAYKSAFDIKALLNCCDSHL